MSLFEFEREVWNEAKQVLCCPKLKLKELLEWSTGEIERREDEVVIRCPKSAVWVAVPANRDLRPA